MAILPPGVSEKNFTQAIQRFERIVGDEWVFTSDEDVRLYRDAYSPLWHEEDEKLASAAVAPVSAEQVQAVVRAASELGIPLYTISTGRNLGYGGSAPVLSGSVVLDLKRMNKILSVDERNANALVEPGVNYFDLYRHIRDNGMKLWIDCPDPGWGSVMGNALDHGAGYTMNPYRDHFRAHCGMEVVLGDGELVRTGMGALPGSQTWQQFSYGYGPYLDGIFSQSNFGVVTKMGIWLLPEPEAYLEGIVNAQRHDDIIPLVDIMSYLMNSGIQNAGTNLQSPLRFAAASHPDVQELLTRADEDAKQALNRFAAENKIPFWSNVLKFYGPEEVVRAQWNYAKQRFASAIPDVELRDGPFYRFPLSDDQIKGVRDESNFGIPSLSIFSIGARSPTNPTPTDGHLWFSPVIPMTGEAVLESQRVLTATLRELGHKVSVNVFPQSYHPRTFLVLIGFPIMHDVEANRSVRASFRRLIQVAAQHGWAEYRTHTAFMDDCARVYSFNDHALLRLHERIKDAVDPNGILSAGRYGIWPKHLRQA
ncbi:MAG TPA: FAD-binding oxidoreductase [Gammaproteobacteria bacterium]|nr:FAD-binding oxidoreductase [Gammaproteobacteria bacterium]